MQESKNGKGCEDWGLEFNLKQDLRKVDDVLTMLTAGKVATHTSK